MEALIYQFAGFLRLWPDEVGGYGLVRMFGILRILRKGEVKGARDQKSQ